MAYDSLTKHRKIPKGYQQHSRLRISSRLHDRAGSTSKKELIANLMGEISFLVQRIAILKWAIFFLSALLFLSVSAIVVLIDK